MLTLTDTFVHADGTPADGSVSIRWATTYFEPSGQRTVTGEWVTQRLDPTGTVTLTLTPPATDHTPAEQYLLVMESVSCSRGHVYAIPSDVISDGVTLYLGAFRTVPELPPPPSYAGGGGGLPGPAGPQGPQGPPGPVGGPGQDAQLPAGSDGQVLQYSGGQWTGSDNLVSALNRTNDLYSIVESLTDDTIEAWQAGTYQAGEVSMHNGALWLATSQATGEPGVDAAWAKVTVEQLYALASAVPPAADARYVNVTGDTMTGTLNVQGQLVVQGGGSSSSLRFNGGGAWRAEIYTTDQGTQYHYGRDANGDNPTAYARYTYGASGDQETVLYGKVQVPRAPTDPDDAARKMDVDAKVDKAGTATTLWGGTKAQFDAIAVKDPGTIYAVTS